MKRTSFTLIELLMAIFVISVLVAIAIGTGRLAWTRSEEAKIRTRMQILETALEQYRRDWGYYPMSPPPGTTLADIDSTGNGKIDLAVQAEAQYFYFDFPFKDRSGNDYLENETMPYRQSGAGSEPFFYQYPSNPSIRTLMNEDKYDLWAPGVDGVTNTVGWSQFTERESDDDITNWTRD